MDPHFYKYPSPLADYSTTTLESLSQEQHTTGPEAKSLINPPSSDSRSEAYDAFPSPITNGSRAGFDVHIYYLQTSEVETKFATELHERVRREFPELRIYKLWDRPIGPHPVAMFEVNLHTTAQFGAFIPWLVINRGPLSALVHPNTHEEYRDHTQRATWMGQPFPLYVDMIRQLEQQREKENRAANA